MFGLFRLSRRIPVRLPSHPVGQKLLAAAVFAVLGTLVAYAVKDTAAVDGLSKQLYDIAYRQRESADRTGSDVVIVAIDQDSLARVGAGMLDDQKLGWPWPRELYGDMVEYLDKAGAKVVGFDMIFSEPDRAAGSDENFAGSVDAANMKVVFGTRVGSDGKAQRIAPPVKEPILGSVQLDAEGVLREYEPLRYGYPSLAYRVAEIFAGTTPIQRDKFFLHYYGPHERKDGKTTYRYLSAFRLLAATRGQGSAAGIDAAMFKNKIVLIGGTSIGLYDAKATPIDRLFPGVEFQATAIENILFRQRVRVFPPAAQFGFTLLGAFSTALAAVVLRRAVLKLAAVLIAFFVVTVICLGLFLGEPIRWMPLAVPLIAMLIAALTSLTWSYFTEGRQRLFISKAFALSTSPVIADAISRNPEKLKLGGERREITVMFTDLAGFTDLAETMDVQKLAHVVNVYMEAMSDEIVSRDGYLDKYIGDAIMSFWNGLVDQPDHAVRACRAALGIKRREAQIAPELEALVGSKVVTRIGINTGPMAVGNLGSSRKLAYTVLGDAVNLGARLEPANKLYDTEILISETTAKEVGASFMLRELDRLAVKGRTQGMPVFELLGDANAGEAARAKVEMYSAGLAHYRSQRWDDAESAWKKLLHEFPDDGPAKKMLHRVERLRHETLPKDWDGVYRSKEK